MQIINEHIQSMTQHLCSRKRTSLSANNLVLSNTRNSIQALINCKAKQVKKDHISMNGMYILLTMRLLVLSSSLAGARAWAME
jgi:hypothetical protein